MIRKNNKSSIALKSPGHTQSFVQKQKTLFRVMHQLDCIYQGEVNQSYQRDGFGIQQTIDFQTYFGWWKNNKANGLGLVIYPNSNILYGSFKDNELCGVAITDDHKLLQIGVFQKYQIIGVGFDYTYQDHKWKMCKYHKGIPIETISTVVSPIEKGVPRLVNIDQKIFTHLHNYISRNYFASSIKIVSKISQPFTQMYYRRKNKFYDYFGQQIQGKYWGIGVLYNYAQGKIVQVGTYQNGQLNQYGLKFDLQHDKMEIGKYQKGRKQGFFYERINNIQKITQYTRNQFVLQHPKLKSQKIKSDQKLFHYRKKDFFSDKNEIQFTNFQHVFQSNQEKMFKRDRQERQKKILKKQNQVISKLQMSKSPAKKQQHKSPGVKKSPKNAGSDNKYVLQAEFQKSSVQIMKQKLFDIENMIYKSKHQHRGTQKKSQYKSTSKTTKPLKKQQQIKHVALQQNFQDVVAIQEKPLDAIMTERYEYEQDKIRWNKYKNTRQFSKTNSSPFSRINTSFNESRMTNQPKKKRIFVNS